MNAAPTSPVPAAAPTGPVAAAAPRKAGRADAAPATAVSVDDAVALVAERLADPERVAAVASRDGNRDPVYDAVMWGPLTLANGLPGTALLYGELARTDGTWRQVAHRHLAAAGRAMGSAPSRGLFSGPAALLAAAQTCAGPEGHYGSLRRRLAAWVAEDQAERLRVFRERTRDRASALARESGDGVEAGADAGVGVGTGAGADAGVGVGTGTGTGADAGVGVGAGAGVRVPLGLGVDWAAYDLINGLSGTTRLLLDSAADPAEAGPAVESALAGSLRHLVHLTAPIRVDGHEVPGWWVPAGLQISDRDRATYPRGDFNLGMAHGIAGPLAVLTSAYEAGHDVPGLRDAVLRIADWLLGWTLHDETGPYWPARAAWDAEVAPRRPRELFTRTAWCYGTPGVAAALFRAGRAMDRPEWCSTAVGALRAALRRDEARWAIEGATVCHGYAGLLRVLARVARVADDAELREGCRRLTAKVLACADEDAPFGFRHLMRFPAAARSPVPHRAVDTAGMLEGAAGVALALLPVGDGPLPWDRTLGLA